MSTAEDVTGASKTPGAHRAQPGEYYFDMPRLNAIPGGPDYSSVFGGVVEGERMIAGMMRMPADTGAEAHSHPNEQWILVLEGTLDMTVGGQRRLVGPREVVYVPSNVVHSSKTAPGEDVVFFTIKDSSFGLYGIRED
jgi:quercetin dioxygenase-like cupin family protein